MKETIPGFTQLISVLNQFYPLDEEIVDYFERHVTPLSVRKGKALLKAGSVCSHIYFIKEGVVRGFMQDGNRDITTWITAENEMVTSIYSLDMRVPALENIQTLEDCELLAITNPDLENLYMRYLNFNIVGRKLLQHYYRDAERRAFIIRLSNAEDKYTYFINNYQHLANRIPLKHIASFLGITLETLSRVRGRMSARKADRQVF